MEWTMFMTPAFIVPIALGLIGFIIWLVRLEGKNSQNAGAMAKIEKEIEKLQLEIEAHRSNQDIHFNIRIAEEVDKRNEERYANIKESIADLHRKFNLMTGRE